MLFVVTDFTEFHNPNFHCVAGLCEDGRCLRPTESYFSKGECAHLNILAGTVLEGDFLPAVQSEPPHTEDCRRKNVHFAHYSRAKDFRARLEADCADSVAEGFGRDLPEYNKCVPWDAPPDRSIVTVRIDPRQGRFAPDQFQGDRLRFTFTDPAGEKFFRLPVADLKLREYAAGYNADAADHLNAFLHRQREAYLRVGIGRRWEKNGHDGFWLQVNGVYTFPDWLPGTRGFIEG
ncbi:hypothetical protein [Pseudodesulfovibrio sp.]|uniref:hypothetical protein n=1 Tax=Pseudodesulfovibrio sp. TaxID=2035812 RepID=UPI00261E6C56|nr:hypothetical protein [Pseudodesulfovibrio sp.]MDD3312345.1 hypothetical protein [Pseudodesulfovibrio sp.]